MKKTMVLGLVLLAALLFAAIPESFAQQQSQPQQQQTVQCPRMGWGGGMNRMGNGPRGVNCPRMNNQCPMARQNCPLLQTQGANTPDSSQSSQGGADTLKQ